MYAYECMVIKNCTLKMFSILPKKDAKSQIRSFKWILKVHRVEFSQI
jgi:hypothetical protein